MPGYFANSSYQQRGSFIANEIGSDETPRSAEWTSSSLANRNWDKQLQRQKLLALPPEEAQARVDAVLYADL